MNGLQNHQNPKHPDARNKPALAGSAKSRRLEGWIFSPARDCCTKFQNCSLGGAVELRIKMSNQKGPCGRGCKLSKLL